MATIFMHEFANVKMWFMLLHWGKDLRVDQYTDLVEGQTGCKVLSMVFGIFGFVSKFLNFISEFWNFFRDFGIFFGILWGIFPLTDKDFFDLFATQT